MFHSPSLNQRDDSMQQGSDRCGALGHQGSKNQCRIISQFVIQWVVSPAVVDSATDWEAVDQGRVLQGVFAQTLSRDSLAIRAGRD